MSQRYRIEIQPGAKQYRVSKITNGVEPVAIFYDIEKAMEYMEWASRIDAVKEYNNQLIFDGMFENGV